MRKGRLLLKITAYMFSALLLISYVAILLSAENPDVCVEYKLYYITKELEDWPGYGGLSCQPGTPVCFYKSAPPNMQADRRGKGWGNLEEDGCWTYGDEAILFFTDIPAKDMKLELFLSDMEDGTSTEVYFNSEKAGTVTALHEPDEPYLFRIPASLRREGLLTVRFRTVRQTKPEHTPALGIKVREITLYEDS